MMRIRKICCGAFHLFVGGMLLTTVGCGGGSEQQVQRSPVKQKSSSVQDPKLKSISSKLKKRFQKKSKKPEMEGNPEDMFEVVDYVHNFEIQKPESTSRSDDLISVVLPAQGDVDSSTFLITASGKREEQGEPDSSFKLPEGFSAIAEAGYSLQGLPHRIRCARDYSEMVLVPAGVSIQGINDGEKNAEPQFTIYQNAFYIDVYEVTLEQYRRWRSEMIAQKGKIPSPAGNDLQPAQFPALGISYTDALNYARTMGKQLPLETQWEKAARGESGFQYPWGNGRPLWQRVRKLGQIDAVGTFPGDQSPYGVFDLAGNAREWCEDWYSNNPYQAAITLADAGVVRDWTGPKRSVIPSMRAVRGDQQAWNVWKRSGENMRKPPADVGFRCVLNLPEVSADSEAPKTSGSF
ncbi:formylglycine-generating enzyme family protein [Gimesia aquarii]|uniref:Serine/threonine-protein kinase pkn1 n=1 Tax=Gimesia aquarii TaxID=2527964 RepID=A0A517VV95_9PLAN|nr:SUMF1/EgtB/PvdO family nonheme iron enzyme [Gimesia aquarii]QDT96913.1 Serine/threonine-protein kinase pkn1 [Gimesia aquarii]